jgi:chemotaxis signal transduction protein
MMLENNGWVISLKGSWYAALGQHELVHVLPYSPVLYTIPQTPPHARHVIVWQEKILPVLDLATYLAEDGDAWFDTWTTEVLMENLVGIVAYRGFGGSETTLGALLLCNVPERVEVTDEQACELPAHLGRWAAVAISCFEHPNYGPVPILDLPRIFSSELIGQSINALQSHHCSVDRTVVDHP